MAVDVPARPLGDQVIALALLRVDGHDDALRTVFLGRIADHLRVGDRRRIEADLVRAGIEQAAHVLHDAHPAAHRQRDEDLRGHRFDDVQDQVATIAGGGDVQEGELVGALLVVAGSDFHRVTGVTQFDEIHALDDATAGHVQAGDDAFGQHVRVRLRLCR